MATPTVTDLGAGGIVTAELFAIEVENLDGSTAITPTRYTDFESAEIRAAQVNQEIADGIVYWWTQVYVVTADGSAV